MYSSTLVANNILRRSFDEKRYISPMKLQKILYFVASEYQKATGKPLLEEQFQTWAYGPVAYAAYDEFRTFSRRPIKKYARDAKGDAMQVDETKDTYLRDVLNSVWDRTKQFNAVQLSELTHERNSAWWKAYQRNSPTLSSEDIENDTTYREVLDLP